MDAWLITWEGSKNGNEGKIAQIVDAKLKTEEIVNIVECIYYCMYFTDLDKLHYFLNRSMNTYVAEITKDNDKVSISCGDNPELYARIVKDLRLNENKQKIEWKEI